MASLDERFSVPDYDKATSLNDAIILGKRYRITLLSDVLVRLEYSENGEFENRPTEQVVFRAFNVPRYTKQEDKNFLVLTTKYFKLEYQKEMPFIGSKVSPDQYLKINLNNSDKFWYFNSAEARNFKGTAYSLDNADGDANYFKGLYSTDGFVSIDDSKSLILNKDGSYSKRNDNRIDTYVFLYRKDFGYCLRDYFRLTGKPALIPRYALGIWWYKNIDYSTEMIDNLMADFRRNEIPLSVLLMGNSWHLKHDNVKNGFTFNYNLIDNPKTFIDNLHSNNIKLGLNINPLEGIHPDEIAYKRFMDASLFVFDKDKKNNGIIPFNIFNKDMVMAYFNELIKPLNDLGTDFFWIDYNNSKDLYTLRALNRYQFLDSKKDINKRGMIFSRNGLIASHRYPCLYSGETIVSWKNLNMIPEFNSKASNIGISWWSHDIGGYKSGVEDPELYMRFCQLGVYSPIFRLSSESSHYYKREPWLWDIKTFSVVKEYLKLRHRLIPYIYTEGFKYSKTGLPIIQPVYYRYPEIYDEPLYKNEYYFGSELFIAPITTKKELLMNRTVHRIFLPNGIWYDFKTGKKYMGGKRYVTFFKDEDYPVFAKRGTIIPLAVLDEDINYTGLPKKIDIHIFPGASNIYKLYEDDGISSMYEYGKYAINDIDYNYQANNFTCIIRLTEGKSEILPEKRDYIVRFRNTRKPSDITVYVVETKIDSFKYYNEVNDFIVEVDNVPTNSQLSINCRGKDIEIEAERIINDDIDSIVSDLQINTDLKELLADILFSDLEVKKKRIQIRKLKRKGLHPKYVTMFLKLLEYIAEL